MTHSSFLIGAEVMTFDELIENLVYSAAVSVTIPNREAPAALAWAAGLLVERYGRAEFNLLRAQRAFERDLASLDEYEARRLR